MKKDCSKFKIWLDKKGTQFSFVCFESHMVNVNHNTWWIDLVLQSMFQIPYRVCKT